MNKYINLANQIFAETNAAHLAYVKEVLRWLDEHPADLPERTITLDTLSAAWDAAEVGTPRKGDVVIEGYQDADDLDGDRPDGTSFDVYQVTADFDPVPAARCLRILSRAPEPSNAEKLAAQIRLTLIENSPDTCKNVQDMVAERIAADLDEAGVKAPEAGGDDA